MCNNGITKNQAKFKFIEEIRRSWDLMHGKSKEKFENTEPEAKEDVEQPEERKLLGVLTKTHLIRLPE